MPFEDEKFSYLAVARETVCISGPSARVVAEPHVTKPAIRLRLCTNGTIEERIVFKRDKPLYKHAARTKWGDSV